MPPRVKAEPRKAPRKAAKGNNRAAEFGGFFGKTGSGKSYAMWQKHEAWQAVERKQVLCWSPKERHDNYAARLKCRAYSNFAEFVKAARHGLDAVYVPSLNREIEEPKFNLFCRLAFALAAAGRLCVLLIDELHTITRSTGGVPAWHEVTTMGRGDGIRVLAASQRPAHVDKDFFGALSYAHTGALLFEEDAKVAAKLVLVTPAEVLALSGYDSRTRSM